MGTAGGTANGDTPAGAFMPSILDAAAEHERALILARTKAALVAKARPRRGLRRGPLRLRPLRRVMRRTSYGVQARLPESVANGCSGQLTCHVLPAEQVNLTGHAKVPHP